MGRGRGRGRGGGVQECGKSISTRHKGISILVFSSMISGVVAKRGWSRFILVREMIGFLNFTPVFRGVQYARHLDQDHHPA